VPGQIQFHELESVPSYLALREAVQSTQATPNPIYLTTHCPEGSPTTTLVFSTTPPSFTAKPE
jgi:hypothetical protein